MAHILHHQVLQAHGKSYHPCCFRCVICKEELEGQAFAVDSDSRVYCISDYHRWNYNNGPTSLAHTQMKGGNPSAHRPHLWLNVSVSVRLLHCYRVQAPHCAACKMSILPTEVSFNNTQRSDFKSRNFPSQFSFTTTICNRFFFILGCFRGLQSLFESCHLTSIIMLSATLVMLILVKDKWLWESLLLLYFSCFLFE